MHQPCKTCPFRETPAEPGALDWLISVMKGIKAGALDHTCHLTDKNADMYAGSTKTKPRDCVGFLGMIKAWDGGCISKRAIGAMVRGEIDWNKLPTKGIFKNPSDLIRFHFSANGVEFDADGKVVVKREH